MTNPRPILFDFGGTLGYIHPSHEWLYIRACREFGVEADPARVRSGSTEDSGWEAYQTAEGPAHPQISTSQSAFARFKTDIIAERLKRSGVTGPLGAIAARVLELDTQRQMYRVYDDTLPALEALQERGHAMAIISNHEWELPDLVAALGLASYFAGVVTSARTGYRKPHPQIFRDALALLGVEPEAAVMVGDSVNSDIVGALRLGMSAMLLDRAHSQGPAAATPVIHRLTALLEVL